MFLAFNLEEMSLSFGCPFGLICWLNRFYHHTEYIIRMFLIAKESYRESKQEYL